jgi:hypothetical protein
MVRTFREDLLSARAAQQDTHLLIGAIDCVEASLHPRQFGAQLLILRFEIGNQILHADKTVYLIQRTRRMANPAIQAGVGIALGQQSQAVLAAGRRVGLRDNFQL